ncbi:ankyrin repeat domain-containing protein 37 isoform 2-T4 [Thomomys bottae]
MAGAELLIHGDGRLQRARVPELPSPPLRPAPEWAFPVAASTAQPAGGFVLPAPPPSLPVTGGRGVGGEAFACARRSVCVCAGEFRRLEMGSAARARPERTPGRLAGSYLPGGGERSRRTTVASLAPGGRCRCWTASRRWRAFSICWSPGLPSTHPRTPTGSRQSTGPQEAGWLTSFSGSCSRVLTSTNRMFGEKHLFTRQQKLEAWSV